MKKLIALALALLLCGICCAEFDEVEVYTIEFAYSGMTADFDGDYSIETLGFTVDMDEYGDGSFEVTVNGSSVRIDNCCMLDSEIYYMKIGNAYYSYGTLFMVNEFGPSDDPVTYCILYTDGKLIDAGRIYAPVRGLTVSETGVITTQIRADHIGTWSRPADYILAEGTHYETDEDGALEWEYRYAICEVPRDIYPMGMVVALKTELPLRASRFDTAASVQLASGETVILAASDDVSWLYVTDLNCTVKGWVRMQSIDYGDYIEINGKYVYVDEVFDDILYAD